MRHRIKKTKTLETGVQKQSNVIRNMVTSLIKEGQVTTTVRKAKVLKAEADKFFAKLVSMLDKYENESDAKREIIRVVKSFIYTETEGKKVVEELLPRYKSENKKTGFVSDYKLGYRPGDSAEKVLVKLL